MSKGVDKVDSSETASRARMLRALSVPESVSLALVAGHAALTVPSALRLTWPHVNADPFALAFAVLFGVFAGWSCIRGRQGARHEVLLASAAVVAPGTYYFLSPSSSSMWSRGGAGVFFGVIEVAFVLSAVAFASVQRGRDRGA